jgi:DNA mismatch repair protein MutL
LRKGRHPVLLVRIALPPDWIDPNTHPTKAEVLLRHERDIARALREALHDALGSAPASVDAPAPHAAHFRPQPSFAFPASRQQVSRGAAGAGPRLRESSAWYAQSLSLPLTAIAQLNDSLILARGNDGALYLVDQHRAHERVLFDYLTRTSTTDLDAFHEDLGDGRTGQLTVGDGYMKNGAEVETSTQQLLLEPQLIELSPSQAAQLAARLHQLATLGLTLQPFGGHVFLARSVPALPGAIHSLGGFVRELAVEAAEDTDNWLDHLRAALACRAAIRRGQSLSLQEQQALLTDLQSASAPAVCPHGSPLVLGLTPAFLADVFEW